MGEFVRLEVADGVGTLRLDRPKMNALCFAMLEEIRALSVEAGERDDVAAVVIYGGERLFAAGADIKELDALSGADAPALALRLHGSLDAVAAIPKPVIAAVTGFALGGGCELAMCADVRLCAEDAQLGLPEMLLGVIPGAGGTQRLPRLVGPGRAKELLFTGRFVQAPEALRIGLVDRVVPSVDVYPEALAWAKQFVNGPAAALRGAKSAVDRGIEVDLATGLAVERDVFAALWATEDKQIGMRSFVEHGPGKAVFTGR
ncbi:MAG TPA: enoyl-CoA hydratase-related protein [Sporichthyaceae bacterium]|nr:enoyl-CoA hydratase-related protein [Sporichthyaceae bacterium]